MKIVENLPTETLKICELRWCERNMTLTFMIGVLIKIPKLKI